VSRININRLASQMLRPNQPQFLPPADEMGVHIATVQSHDLGRNESTVVLNDPNGTVLTRVPLLATGYTPAAGDVVQLLQIGNSMGTLVQQNRPSGIVSF
jgi:hypothetical protein